MTFKVNRTNIKKWLKDRKVSESVCPVSLGKMLILRRTQRLRGAMPVIGTLVVGLMT